MNSPNGRALPPAVILAAGEGRRLRNRAGSPPKPLVSLIGLSLAERSVCRFLEAGVRRFIVVLGHESEQVRAHFEEIGRRRDCEIACVVAAEWQRGNGSSVLASEAEVAGDAFLLTMVDHLLSPGMIEAILACPPSGDEIVLAVDGASAGIFDPADLTKVSRHGTSVRKIGKDLVTWDGGDTGLFYCTSAIFQALDRARAKGMHSLTDGVRECIESGGVRAVDVSGHPWLDVDTPQALVEAKRRIQASLSKQHEDGFVSQHFNRRISRPLSLLLARTPITPDQITVASFLLGLWGAGLLAREDPVYWIAGGLIIQGASILDGCDGEVARLKHRSSPRGAWLDTILDRYADMAVTLAVTFAYAAVHPGALPWIIGFLTAFGFILASYVTKEFAIRTCAPYPNDAFNRLKRRDLRILLIALGAVVGFPFEALAIAGALTHLCVIGVLVKGWRISRHVR